MKRSTLGSTGRVLREACHGSIVIRRRYFSEAHISHSWEFFWRFSVDGSDWSSDPSYFMRYESLNGSNISMFFFSIERRNPSQKLLFLHSAWMLEVGFAVVRLTLFTCRQNGTKSWHERHFKNCYGTSQRKSQTDVLSQLCKDGNPTQRFHFWTIVRLYRKIHCLTSEFHVKFHAKNRYRTNRFAIRDIGFSREI